MCLLSLSWGTCGFSAPCHAAGCPSGVPHLAVSGWLTYSCGVGFAWSWGCLSTDVLLPSCVSSLCLRSFPFGVLQPLTGELACLTPVCWSTPGVGLEGSFLRHLVCSHVPYSSSGPAACAAFPAAGYLRVFRSPGVCTSASLVTWVGLQPFPSFSGLLLLCLLAGVVGVLHPGSGCSSCGVVCLVCR